MFIQNETGLKKDLNLCIFLSFLLYILILLTFRHILIFYVSTFSQFSFCSEDFERA